MIVNPNVTQFQGRLDEIGFEESKGKIVQDVNADHKINGTIRGFVGFRKVWMIFSN